MENSSINVSFIANFFVRDDPRVITEAISLTKVGYHVCIIGAPRLGGQKARETIHNIDIFNVPLVKSWNPFSLLREIWRLVRGQLVPLTPGEEVINNSKLATLLFIFWALRLGFSIRAEVIHAHDIAQLVPSWLLASIKRTRLIYNAHDDATEYYGRVGGLIEKRLISRADAVITVGECLAETLRNLGAREVVIVGNWKNLQDYDIAENQLEALRQKLDLADSLVICYFGSLEPIRYFSELLLAVEQSSGVTLLIAGRGPTAQEILTVSKRASNIRWLGWLNMVDLPLYTRLADVVFC